MQKILIITKSKLIWCSRFIKTNNNNKINNFYYNNHKILIIILVIFRIIILDVRYNYHLKIQFKISIRISFTIKNFILIILCNNLGQLNYFNTVIINNSNKINKTLWWIFASQNQLPCKVMMICQKSSKNVLNKYSISNHNLLKIITVVVVLVIIVFY